MCISDWSSDVCSSDRLPVDRNALSMALGRVNAVHLALTDARAADRVLAHLRRWQFFTGWFRDAATRGPAADSRSAGNEAAPTASAPSDAQKDSGFSLSDVQANQHLTRKPIALYRAAELGP